MLLLHELAASSGSCVSLLAACHCCTAVRMMRAPVFGRLDLRLLELGQREHRHAARDHRHDRDDDQHLDQRHAAFAPCARSWRAASVRCECFGSFPSFMVVTSSRSFDAIETAGLAVRAVAHRARKRLPAMRPGQISRSGRPQASRGTLLEARVLGGLRASRGGQPPSWSAR